MRTRKKIFRGSNADILCMLFGGAGELAKELGVDHAVVHRWRCGGKRGGEGRVPTRYNLRILEAADRLEIDRADVAELLDQSVCPTCGQAMP